MIDTLLVLIVGWQLGHGGPLGPQALSADYEVAHGPEHRETRERVPGYLLRLPSWLKMTAHQRELMVDALDGRPVYLDDGAATFLSCRPPAEQEAVMNDRVAQIRVLMDAGVNVVALLSQSTLSKAVSPAYPGCVYPLADRVEDVLTYAIFLHTLDPGIGIGIIDAGIAKNQTVLPGYLALAERLAAHGIPLFAVMHDMPAERATSGAAVRLAQAQALCRELGCRTQILATSGASAAGDFRRAMLRMHYFARGTGAEELLVSEWYDSFESDVTLLHSAADLADLARNEDSLVWHLYTGYLQRAPDDDGLAWWLDYETAFGPAATARHFLGGLGYQGEESDYGVSEFVRALYRAVLRRDPAWGDTGGHDYWALQLVAGMSRKAVVEAVVDSEEFAALYAPTPLH